MLYRAILKDTNIFEEVNQLVRANAKGINADLCVNSPVTSEYDSQFYYI